MANDLKTLANYLKTESGPGPGSFFSIGAEGLNQAAKLWSCSLKQSMIGLLKQDIWPRRFLRNRGTLSAADQARLLQATAAVIGCGGLGGYVSTLLARVGWGTLILCDGDSFDESNLNRQLLSKESNLGRNKAEVAAEEVNSIASHVELKVWPENAGRQNLSEIIKAADIVFDCLDSLATRRLVEAEAHAAGHPFVHGAIAGDEAFVMITRGEGPTLSSLYGPENADESCNAERRLGVPTITPPQAACLQVKAAINELLAPGKISESLVHVDLSVPAIEILQT